MRTSLSTAAALLAAAQYASAQTFTACNPLDKTCPPDQGLGETITIDFRKGANDFFTYAAGTTLTYDSVNGANFAISTATEAPTISSSKYIMFGKVSVFAQAAPGVGIVSSFILQSDDLDEIDWEWLGGDNAHVESNFFGKGNTTTYNRAIYQGVTAPTTGFHTYTIDWTAEAINWIIDGSTVRTLAFGDPLALGGLNYPQTPMMVKMGNWVGCADAAAASNPATAGTCSWAGGPATFGGPTYNMYVQTVTIQDYGCGSQYTYSDNSGSWQSIKASGGCSGGSTTGTGSSSSASSTAPASSSTPASSSSSSSSSSTSVKKSSSSSKSQTVAPTTAASSTSAPTTLPTAASNSTASGTGTGSPSTAAASSSPASPSHNAASHSYGLMDFSVMAVGLGLGYLVM